MIRFFILHCEKRNRRGYWKRVDPQPVFDRIVQLPLDDPQSGRYSAVLGGDADTLFSADELGPDIRGIFAKVRRSGLPSIEQAGNIRPLSIAVDEGLFEPCHFILFEGTILGYEGNFFGPRAGRLARYVADKSQNTVERARLETILRSDWQERLQRIGAVRWIKIRIARDRVREARLLDENLGRALQATSEASEAEQVELVLRGRAHSRKGFRLPWLGNIARFLRRERAHSGTSRFEIRAKNMESGKVETIDLLQEALAYVKPVRLRQRKTRAVDPLSAFQAIQEAFEESERELRPYRGTHES